MRIGILGAGQLGRMLAQAGEKLGCDFKFYNDSESEPCRDIAEVMVGDFNDIAKIEHFAEDCEVITYEFENVPVEAANALARKKSVYPTPRALEIAQDRMREKRLFASLNIPVTDTETFDSLEGLRKAVERIGAPCVLKTRYLGYDGKGQFVIKTPSEVESAWKHVGGGLLILEEFVNFTRELSIISVRGRGGEITHYPLIQNTHTKGILSESVFPAPDVSQALTTTACGYAEKILVELDYVGVLTLEMFEVNGKLFANEMAPRVHNSGHVTIEAAMTSQFENHIRAITDMPLGSTDVKIPSTMLNLIGDLSSVERLSAVKNAHVHLYGKTPRPGRKVGHITITSPGNVAEARALIRNC